MKTIPFTLCFALFITISSFSQTGAKNFIDQPYIEVTGRIETEIIPNEIFINIVINENDKKGKISVEDQENKMIAILKSLAIDLDKDFSILDINGFYKKKFLKHKEPSTIKRYELIVHNGEILSKVYQALDQIDISNISITKTSHSDIEKLGREAKLKALKIAKEKATDYAQIIDQTLGKALYIQEIGNNTPHFLGYANSINFRGESSTYQGISELKKAHNLHFKPIIISATVLAKFALN